MQRLFQHVEIQKMHDWVNAGGECPARASDVSRRHIWTLEPLLGCMASLVRCPASGRNELFVACQILYLAHGESCDDPG